MNVVVYCSICNKHGRAHDGMVLISEVTTPEINLRWYLDVSGVKKTSIYMIN
ncbi:hypothetical protein ACS0TY_017609 [Phlomoides rotata]